MTYEIVTTPYKWKVKRQDKDITDLRFYLARMFPQVIVPPLPHVKTNKRMTQRQMIKKERRYERFFNSIFKSHILRSNSFLVDFFKESDLVVFKKKKESAMDEQSPKSIFDFQTLSGQIEVSADLKSIDYFDKVSYFIPTVRDRSKIIAQRIKKMQFKANALADEYFTIAHEVSSIAQEYKQVESEQNAFLYNKLFELIEQAGKFQIQQAEVIRKSVGDFLKYNV